MKLINFLSLSSSTGEHFDFLLLMSRIKRISFSRGDNNYLGRHVSLRADFVVELNVDGIRDYVVPNGQSEVAYSAGTISLHEDIF